MLVGKQKLKRLIPYKCQAQRVRLLTLDAAYVNETVIVPDLAAERAVAIGLLVPAERVATTVCAATAANVSTIDTTASLSSHPWGNVLDNPIEQGSYGAKVIGESAHY